MKRFLRMSILWLVRLLGWPRSLRKPASRANDDTASLRRVLLVRPDHLGDLLMTTPVLQALKDRAPDLQLTLMVGPWSSEIVARHPALDKLIICPFPGFRRAHQGFLAPYKLLFSTARQLRQERYDLAVNLRPDFWWGAALLYLAGIPRRVGYALEPGRPFLNHALPFVENEHATISNLRLASAALEDLGYSPLEQPFTPARYPLHFVPTADERAWALQRLHGEGVEESAPLIVIPPGSGGAVKLWRSEAWGYCANTLLTTLTSPSPARIMLTGSSGERALLEEVARHISSNSILVTDANIGQLAALLERATCVLTVDNGAGHMAVTRDVPSIHLFGPTDPRIFGPWGDPQKHRIIAGTLACPGCPAIPCGRLDFSPAELAHHPCVRLIGEQEVLEAARGLLRTTQPQISI